ncbi:phage fiber-tail adaptor protein [Streptomyces roseolus]|uniref:phage fiber-tail adaptor protein n=1 Tax=Streptomyces roseolus TaxID=67358 RepID=UPI0016740922|nr:hypothetical protein [Streptomyces roseolus]GGR51974.1 hypothetical protein GCM10010282_51170 [Streptomyces roseolus]
MRTWEKDPQAVLDWMFDWSNWLAAGESISGTPVVTVDSGLTKDSQSNTTTKVTCWLSGGTLGATYKVACRITTNQGRTDERTIAIRVTDR